MTKTSTFGVSRRENHDSSAYYARHLETVEEQRNDHLNPLPLELTNQLVLGSSEHMDGVPDDCIALMVTSPNYDVGKDSDLDMSRDEYLGMLERVLAETYRVLEPGGRVAINVANLGRRPYVRFTDLLAEMLADLGFFCRGEIIWVKGKGASGSVAFGSYMKPSNPVLRDLHEYVLVYSKGRFDRAIRWQDRQERGLPWEATITSEDFLRSTLSVWEIPAESATRVGHPAPFPVELPRRLIELYTYAGDVVLDPFLGSGTTAVAAARCGRRFLGYEINEKYLGTAINRVGTTLASMQGEVL